MHGDLGNKLVQHAKRTQTLPTLPPYQTELVRAVVREIRDLDRDVARILEPFNVVDEDGSSQSTFSPAEHPETACTLLVDHLSMRRNKRCLLAYHRVRAEKLEGMAWEGRDMDVDMAVEDEGANANATNAKDGNSNAGGAQNSWSPEEESYFRKYVDLLAQVKGQWTDIDLTGSLEPPKDLFIDVRVLKDAGEIQTEYGAINLTKNSQFYVRQGDVERLIQMGFLQRLS
ncbi:DNA replication protein psf1 [Elasticomyces elasticus]|uniref:DNA replication complex GINS protein PSF1 n=1 Tax=Exophiala sideris TaxID=1016849 RepID=A0ABR0J627_9EURO|nr:DNA replication protein psf1 [Elasticomyces elasticus]KAK5028296.1 DNA replication protein psf1 [Exophiala sideris]KAK5036059.1 DNA replication protein psf1 [Exophiala sideris]KAK5057096.1 DNA replication protein psf1 [Exophiala sideris]KAK5181503.1 DNA replication protein psf1 [Eurotiomycetes sp. CCFEE 6388]